MNSPEPISSGPLWLLIGLLMFSSISGSGAQAQVTSMSADKPAATIKSIAVGQKDLVEVTTTQATVTRAKGGEVLAASAGTLLFTGDLIQTFGETSVTVLFFDAPFSERDNEVIIKENSKVGISSTISWWGKIWVKVKGTFNSNSTYVRLAASGTEYEFTVPEDGQDPSVVVLEGAVKYTEGQFPLTQAKLTDSMTALYGPSPFYLLRNFAHAWSPQVQTGMSIDVQAGQVLDFSGTYHVLNDCRQTHYFEFRTSNTPWLRLVVQQKAAVPPRVSLPISAILRFDATSLLPGQYRANVYAICVDCNKEPRCTQSQLDWPLNVTVKPNVPPPPPSPSPTPSPSPSPNGQGGTQTGEVPLLQEMVFTKGVDRPNQATDARVLSVLAWTNRVLLTTQPTYSTQNVIPHFSTVEQRSRSFTTARQNAILKQDPVANQVVGHVYTDWGQGQRAVEAYEKAGQVVPSDLVIDKSEAYRLTGQLTKAEALLNTLPPADSQSVRALNALGNVNLNFAQVAADTGNDADAVRRFQKAKESYTAAITAPQGGRPQAEVATKSNLGEAYLREGELVQTRGNLQKAKDQFLLAQESLQSIQQSNTIYPFPATNLGRAYQGLGNVAHLEGDEAGAKTAYQRAERLHREAISAHRDFAEAYFNLGDLFDDQGNEEAAKANYWLAVRSRPEQPAAYYPLAVLVQKENPRLAAALAATYLQLEPEVFKHGEKAKDAAAIAGGHDAHPRPRPFEVTPVRGTGTITDTDSRPGTVPNLLNKTSEQAVGAIQAAGFKPGKIDGQRNKPEYIVVRQDPAAGSSATAGSAINLTIEKGIEVPDTTDDRQATATKKLRDKQLRLGTVEPVTDCRPVGNVVRTNPVRHTRVAPDTVVNLLVASLGDNPITIPDLIRRSREDAESEIRQLGLNFRKPQSEESDEREGTVIKQKPDAGRRYAKGCPVDVEVTVAVPWVIVGNYQTLNLEDARRRVRSIDLYESVLYQPSTDYEVGTVISQSPSPGSRVKHRSQVTLTVASNAPHIAQEPRMPSVFGMHYEKAKSLLEQLGLHVNEPPGCEQISQIEKQWQGPPLFDGMVIGQNPEKGSLIGHKPPVTLKIARNSCAVIY